MNWLLDNMRFEQSFPWFLPQPPMPSALRPPVFPFRIPDHQFFGYMHPTIDRLSVTMSDENPTDYYAFYAEPTAQYLDALIESNQIPNPCNKKYEILNCLGRGGYGQAYNARRRSDNRQTVIKYLPKDSILNWSTIDGKRVPYEIDILYRLRGVSGIIRIYEHFEEPDRFVFAMERVPNSCTLFDFVMDHSSLANTETLRHIFRELVRINLLLQTYGIWHRDCKPENVLYCKNDRSLRFIDFGSAGPVQAEDFREFQGTLEIMVPEWILQKRYDGEKACVWTLGVCLYFLLFRQYPFRSKVQIVNGRSHLPFKDSPDSEAYQTMKQCLHGNEHRRPKLNSLHYLSWLQEGYSS